MHWGSESPSPGEGKGSEADGGALCLCYVNLQLFEWTTNKFGAISISKVVSRVRRGSLLFRCRVWL
jgi:hypothetical protein